MVDDYYCREHILIAVDNSKRKDKNKAKQVDAAAGK
jgi:hypothetical protein